MNNHSAGGTVIQLLEQSFCSPETNYHPEEQRINPAAGRQNTETTRQ
jgi:hypothetical protein